MNTAESNSNTVGGPYRTLFSCKACTKDEHATKKNCKSNPRCVYGLGEKKEGIWAKSFAPENTIGFDPAERLRNGKLAGLNNMGATCYLNVILQAFFHLENLRQAVYNLKTDENKDNDIAVLKALQDTFRRLEHGFLDSYTPKEFVESLGLNKQSQQDPQEFIKLFLGKFEKLWKVVHDESITPLDLQLTGREETCVQCSNCKYTSKNECLFTELKLFLEGHSDINSSLAGYENTEHLVDENRYYCSQCQSRQDATKQTKVTQYPDVVLLQLLRYKFDRDSGERKKIQEIHLFPNNLNLGGDDYTLSSVIYHKGTSAYGGHYVCDALHWKTDEWWHFDDNLATVIENPSANQSKMKSLTSTEESTNDVVDVDSDYESNKKASNSKKIKFSDSEKKNESSPLKWREKNRFKDVYALFYVKTSILQEFKRGSRRDIRVSDDFLSEIQKEKSAFDEEITAYKANLDELNRKINQRKEDYSWLTDHIPVRNTNPEATFHLVPASWLKNWIIGSSESILSTQQSSESSKSDTSSSDNGVVDITKETDSTVDNEGAGTVTNQEPMVIDDSTDNQPQACTVISLSQDIKNVPFLCTHKIGLDMNRIHEMKVISDRCFDYLTNINGVKIDLDLNQSNFACQECISDFFSNREVSSSKYMLFNDIVRLVESSPAKFQSDDSFYVASTWITSVKKAKEALLKEADKAIGIPAKRGTITSFATPKAMSDTFLDNSVNSVLFCDHKNPLLQFQRRARVISGNAWRQIKSVFPEAIALPYLGTNSCPICQSIDEKRSSDKEQRMREASVRCLQQLCKRKSIHPLDLPLKLQEHATKTGDHSNESLRLVDYQWMKNWRAYIANPQAPHPGTFTNSRLRCTHGKSLVCKPFRNIIAELSSLQTNGMQADDFNERNDIPKSEIITSEQWFALRSLYGPSKVSIQRAVTESSNVIDVDRDVIENPDQSTESNTDQGDVSQLAIVEDPFIVSLQFCMDGSVSFNPEVCDICTQEAENKDNKLRSVFENALIKVVIITEDTEVEEKEDMGRSRRSKRRRKLPVNVTISASSSDTVALIKLKLYETLDNETYPSCQRLFHNDVELTQQSKTLSSFGILAGDTITARITKANEDGCHFGDTLFMYDNENLECGFSDSGLFVGSHSAKKAKPDAKDEGIVNLLVDEEAVQSIVSMGFDEEIAKSTLASCNWNVQQALEKLLG